MASAEGVRLAKTISSSSRFAMRWRARTKQKQCSSWRDRRIVGGTVLGGILESVKSTIIPLRVKPENRSLLLRHPVYKKRDVVDLFMWRKPTCKAGYLP